MNTNNTNNKSINETRQPGKFSVFITSNKESIEACLQLRHEVFNTETDTSINNLEKNFSKDRFDELCKHVMVVEKSTNRVVATTRLLSSSDITYTGFFYLETEFDISSLHDLPGVIMEVGRICIHKDFRQGIVLGKLLQAIAKVVSRQKIDYLISCACIKINNDHHKIKPLMQHLRKNYFSNKENRVHPLVSLASEDNNYIGEINLPTLLKGYINHGAVVCGDPYWNVKTSLVDVFVLLEVKNINKRYSRYFSNKISA